MYILSFFQALSIVVVATSFQLHSPLCSFKEVGKPQKIHGELEELILFFIAKSAKLYFFFFFFFFCCCLIDN